MSRVVSVKTTVKSYIKKSYSNKENLRQPDISSAKSKKIIRDINNNPDILSGSFKGITLLVKPRAFTATGLPSVSDVISIGDGGLRTEILRCCADWAKPDLLKRILDTELNIFIEELPSNTSISEHVTRLNGSRATTSFQRAIGSPSLNHLSRALSKLGAYPLDTRTADKAKLNTQTYILKALYAFLSPDSAYKSNKADSIKADWESLLLAIGKEKLSTFTSIIEGIACSNLGLPTEKMATPSMLKKDKNYIVSNGVVCVLLTQIRNYFYDEEKQAFLEPGIGNNRKALNAAEVLLHPKTALLLKAVRDRLILKPEINTFCQDHWGKNFFI